jgi:hypothetical protein
MSVTDRYPKRFTALDQYLLLVMGTVPQTNSLFLFGKTSTRRKTIGIANEYNDANINHFIICLITG